MSTSLSLWLLVSLSSVSFFAIYSPVYASAFDVFLAATMGSAANTLSITPADRIRIASMIAPAWDQLTPGMLNAFNFTRPEGLRQFHLYVPSAYTNASAWPLSFYFHGYQGDWRQGVQLNMTRDAEELGYLLIFGQGTPASTGQLGWNGGVCCLFNASSIVDDVAFARTAVKMVQAVANIDAQRIYTMGWSNGPLLHRRTSELCARCLLDS
jgi:poly(3-hydroxybutyrate) depolymerase